MNEVHTKPNIKAFHACYCREIIAGRDSRGIIADGVCLSCFRITEKKIEEQIQTIDGQHSSTLTLTSWMIFSNVYC